MRLLSDLLRRHSIRLVALVLLAVLYGFARQPSMTESELGKMAEPFRFTRTMLPELNGSVGRVVRPVHPSLENISAWISSVGAAVAMADLDRDGLANDLCWVDTRVDQVLVAPAPGTDQRYPLFALDPAPLPYDEQTTAPMGCVPGDLNEDGHLDLLVYYWGRTPIAFMHRVAHPEAASLESAGLSSVAAMESANNADNLHAAAFQAVELVPGGERWFTNALTRADVDGDGHPDLVVGNYFQDGARILDRTDSEPQVMHASMSRAFNGGVNRILLWQPPLSSGEGQGPSMPRFREAPGVFSDDVAQGWTLAVGAADLDGDLLPELYFANDFGPDRLLHNRSSPGQISLSPVEGRRTLSTPRSKVLGRDSFKGMGVDFADLNGDGWLDIYVSNIAQEYALEESHFLYLSTGEPQSFAEGEAPYVDLSEDLGLSRSAWGWDTRLADFDNDGAVEALQATGFVRGTVNRWPQLHELAMGNDEMLSNPGSWLRVQPGDDLSGYHHNPFWVRSASGRYFDLAEQLGMDQPQVTRGLATGDVDGDGDLDFVVANQWEQSAFYRNDSPGAGHALVLRLLLPLEAQRAQTRSLSGAVPSPRPARFAIGAAATVHLPDGQRLVAQVDGGNGHSGVRSPDLHFGLGFLDPQTPVTVDLAWRDLDGAVHRESLRLSAGTHTLLLGDAS